MGKNMWEFPTTTFGHESEKPCDNGIGPETRGSPYLHRVIPRVGNYTKSPLCVCECLLGEVKENLGIRKQKNHNPDGLIRQEPEIDVARKSLLEPLAGAFSTSDLATSSSYLFV